MESKSSENSENSLRQKRPAPVPPTMSTGRAVHSIPDVAAVSHQDLNLSRMSRISTGSSGSGQESRPDSYGQATPPRGKLPETSTPAQQFNNGARHSNSLEELDECSPFPRQQQPADFRRTTLGSGPSTATRILQYSSTTPTNTATNRLFNQSRELPPTPSDKDNHLQPSDRLDRLMAVNQLSSNSLANSSNSSEISKNNMYSPRDNYNYQPPQHLANKPPTPRGLPSQPPGPYRVPPHNQPVRGRSMDSYSPASQASPQQYSPNGPMRPSPQRDLSRHGPSPLSNSRQPNYQDSNTFQNSSADVYSSVEENRTRNSVEYSPDKSSVQSNGPVQGSQDYHYARVQRIERPKSVPPNIFNQLQMQAQQTHQTQDSGPIYSQPHKAGRTPPVPPPRRNRDPVVTMGRVSLVREPGQGALPNRTMPTGRMSATPYQSSGSNSPNGPVNKTLPPGGVAWSPTARAISGVKVANTLPSPRQLKPEESSSEPVKNALWYEYGCV